jgi:DNA-binding response OmpR family regulator
MRFKNQFKAKTVERESKSIVLTAKEFKLLLYLVRNKEMIVSENKS